MTGRMDGKILVLTENFPPIDGGSGRWFWELYSRLPKEQVLIVAHNEQGAEAFDKTHDIEVLRIPLKSTEWGLKSLTGLKFYWRKVREIRRIVRQYGITQIHCGRVIHEGVTAWLLSFISPVKYLCFVHGEDVETAATSREQSLLVRKVCQRASVLVCNSKNSGDLVSSLGFSSAQKCQILHPGVDTQRFVIAAPDEHFKKKMGWQGKLVLLTVGRLQRRKGQDYLLQAMPKLLEQIPNLHYVIIGRGELLKELQSSVVELGLDQHVSILSDADDEMMIQCYQQCDAFILPNRTIENDIEGFGMVLIEAQACGKPVFAGDSGGTKETLAEGRTGSVIDCSTPNAIVTALLPKLQQLEQFDNAQQIADFAISHFDWNAHVEKASKIFEQV